jgi:hypothetical protein
LARSSPWPAKCPSQRRSRSRWLTFRAAGRGSPYPFLGGLLEGVTVSFSAPATGDGATLSAANAVTNSSGVAGVSATDNSSAGGYNATASLGSLTAAFSLTNTAFSPCDVNQDGKTNVLDVRKTIDEALGRYRRRTT